MTGRFQPAPGRWCLLSMLQKKLAGLLDTTVGYLLGESEDHDLFKDPEMLKRFKELKSIGAKEREHILFALDSMLKNIKLKSL